MRELLSTTISISPFHGTRKSGKCKLHSLITSILKGIVRGRREHGNHQGKPVVIQSANSTLAMEEKGGKHIAEQLIQKLLKEPITVKLCRGGNMPWRECKPEDWLLQIHSCGGAIKQPNASFPLRDETTWGHMNSTFETHKENVMRDLLQNLASRSDKLQASLTPHEGEVSNFHQQNWATETSVETETCKERKNDSSQKQLIKAA